MILLFLILTVFTPESLCCILARGFQHVTLSPALSWPWSRKTVQIPFGCGLTASWWWWKRILKTCGGMGMWRTLTAWFKFEPFIFIFFQWVSPHLYRSLIMGFVSKCKEKLLLKKKQKGTFLIRFSESVIGGITFSWVEIDATGEYVKFGNRDWYCSDGMLTFVHVPFISIGDPEVKTIQPFTKTDLSQIPFHEIIRHFLILKEVPQNPLLYLYPNTPKDEAFGKYYADMSGSKKNNVLVFFVIQYIFL